MICANMIAFGKAVGATKPYKARLEYLELDSYGEGVGITLPQIDTSKFDIGYTFKTSLYCEVEPESSGTGRFILHLGGTSQYNAPIFVGNLSGNIAVFSTGIGQYKFPQASTLENYTFSLVNDRMTATNDTTGDAITYKWTTNPFSDTGLFSYDNYQTVYRIGATQMLCGTEMLFDAIPVVSFDGVVCFYDRVSKSLVMPNEGWTFIAGPEIIEYTAKDYIQDGLVAMWDGIDTSVNTITFSSTAGVEFDGYFGLRNNATSTNYIEVTDVANIEEAYKSGEFTFETILDFATYQYVFVRMEPIPYKLNCYGYEPLSIKFINDLFLGISHSAALPLSVSKHSARASFSRDSWLASLNDVSVNRTFPDGADPSVVEISKITCGLSPSSAIGALRFYNRPLTDEEMAYNYSIDK